MQEHQFSQFARAGIGSLTKSGLGEQFEKNLK